jgi:hypothetical protein
MQANCSKHRSRKGKVMIIPSEDLDQKLSKDAHEVTDEFPAVFHSPDNKNQLKCEMG